MTPRRRALTIAALVVCGAAAIAAAVVFLRVRHAVREAVEATSPDVAVAEWVALAAPTSVPRHWLGDDVTAALAHSDGLLLAGGFGAELGAQTWGLACGMPTARVATATMWRGIPVLAAAAGGMFRLRGSSCEELRSGHGALHARALHETEAGELIVSAREGLFRLPWGSGSMERVMDRSARACVSHGSTLVVGTEDGLFRVGPAGPGIIATPDPWIEDLAVIDGRLLATTAAGLASGPLSGPLEAIRGAEDVVQGVAHAGRFYAVTDPPRAALRVLDPATGRLRDEATPALADRTLTGGGALLIDTPRGLFRRGRSGWRVERWRRPEAIPPGPCHIAALAATRERIVAGLFGHGVLAASSAHDGALAWRVPRGSPAWGINAVLDAGGTTFVASLRGLARLEGDELRAVDDVDGSAFALLSTPAGLLVGQGLGLRLPSGRVVSAFHGLPGNQITALARRGETVIAGTPSGLGGVRDGRVVWSVRPGEGRLPHPWVTALAQRRDEIYIGTYGGGIVRLRPPPTSSTSEHEDPGLFEPFAETEGLRVSPGCIAANESEVLFGTEARGLWRMSRDAARFEPLRLPLPGSRIAALAWQGTSLLVGTDEGLARIDLAGQTGAR